VTLLLVVAGVAAGRRPSVIPTGIQNAFEAALDFVLGLIDDVIGPEGRRYLPLIATLGLFIFGSNLLGLIPGFTAPTDNLNTTAACALWCSSRITGSASASTASGRTSSTSRGRRRGGSCR
jgi:F-type H+-transporting ATPase subunit a